MVEGKSEPTIGELLGSLAGNTASLVRQEVNLASTEIAQKASRATTAAGTIGIGAAILLVGALMLAEALVMGIGVWVPMWMSALGVGVVTAAIGFAVLQQGKGALKNVDPIPRKTVQTIKDDGAWAKGQVQ